MNSLYNHQFVQNVNSENNSSFVNFESDSDMILNDFLSADGFFGEAYRTMNNPGEDDLMDEQLQMVLRISLEEEKKRIEEMEKKKLEQAGVRVTRIKSKKRTTKSRRPISWKKQKNWR